MMLTIVILQKCALRIQGGFQVIPAVFCCGISLHWAYSECVFLRGVLVVSQL